MVVNRQGRDLSKREKDELREMLREVEIFKELVSSMVAVMGGQRGRRWARAGLGFAGQRRARVRGVARGFSGGEGGC